MSPGTRHHLIAALDSPDENHAAYHLKTENYANPRVTQVSFSAETMIFVVNMAF
ncbi:hypothetical protein [Desulfovibrio sp. Huiquan2017]|uniref:hypothetical protein n=1 Tax=Desulfovibrio sp. Huiquan2017 TaxID=2816861 RepID=UPI001A91AE21|nr:hypothetical protein [Desulfovibrio sp. Huiquan2017]